MFGSAGTIPGEGSVMWYQDISAQREIAGVGVQQVPGERAGVLAVSENTVGINVLHLQPHLVSPVEVQDDRVAGGGWDGCFGSFDYRVEIAEQTDFKCLRSNSQVEGEDVRAVDGSCVDASGVKVTLLVGNDAGERNG